VLKIGVFEIDHRLSFIEVVHYRHEFVGVGFANMLQLGIVILDHLHGTYLGLYNVGINQINKQKSKNVYTEPYNYSTNAFPNHKKK